MPCCPALNLLLVDRDAIAIAACSPRNLIEESQVQTSIMCQGKSCKEKCKRGNCQSVSNAPFYRNYSYVFAELETQLIIHRALLMQRLVQDPFYEIMNISPASRLWMLRHLAHLADHAETRYRINLMQFFELMGRHDMLKFLRHKNAPNEMIVRWANTHPIPTRPASA